MGIHRLNMLTVAALLASCALVLSCSRNAPSEPQEESGNHPPNVPIVPSGPATGEVDTSYSFLSRATDPDGDSVAIRFAWGDGDTSAWTFDSSGSLVSMSHSWTSSSTWYVKAQAKDVHDAASAWSDEHAILISGAPNNPPGTPSTPTGPSSGYVNTSYSFLSSASDPDGDSVAIRFAWGDGDTSAWSFDTSGSLVSMSHSWTSSGTSYVKAQAKDVHDAASAWSDSQAIEVSVFPWYFFPEDNEISGWVKEGPAETATTPQELWDLIDGEGQVFIDHGFSSCGRQVYKGSLGGSEVDIRYLYIYDLGADSNASAVYNDPRSGTGVPWLDNPAGTEARINDLGLSSYTIDFWQSKYFAKITILDKSSEALDVIKLFCHNISDKMPC